MASVPGSSVEQTVMTTSTDKRPSVSGIDVNGSESVRDSPDPAAPSKEVSSTRQRLSDLFTIFCAGFALISDGYQNNLMYVSAIHTKRRGDMHAKCRVLSILTGHSWYTWKETNLCIGL